MTMSFAPFLVMILPTNLPSSPIYETKSFPKILHNEKCQPICNDFHFTLVFSDLYRKSLDGTLLRCVEMDESKKASDKVQIGICGSHSNGVCTFSKIS